MIYSPTITAEMALNGAHDSAVLQLTKVKCPIKKADLQRQEALIMTCFLALLGSLSQEEQNNIFLLKYAQILNWYNYHNVIYKLFEKWLKIGADL